MQTCKATAASNLHPIPPMVCKLLCTNCKTQDLRQPSCKITFKFHNVSVDSCAHPRKLSEAHNRHFVDRRNKGSHRNLGPFASLRNLGCTLVTFQNHYQCRKLPAQMSFVISKKFHIFFTCASKTMLFSKTLSKLRSARMRLEFPALARPPAY